MPAALAHEASPPTYADARGAPAQARCNRGTFLTTASQSIVVPIRRHLCTPRLSLRLLRPQDRDVVLEALLESRESLIRWVPDIGHRHTVEDVALGLEILDAAHR